MTGLAGGCTPEDMFLGTLPRTPGNLGPPQEPRGHSHRPQRPSPGPRKPGGRPGIQRFPETPGTLPKIPGNQGTSQEPRGPPGPRDLPQDHGKPGPPLGSPGPSPQLWFPPLGTQWTPQEARAPPRTAGNQGPLVTQRTMWEFREFPQAIGKPGYARGNQGTPWEYRGHHGNQGTLPRTAANPRNPGTLRRAP
jgi:hypothetical protein